MTEELDVFENEEIKGDIVGLETGDFQFLNSILTNDNPQHLSGMFRGWFLEYASYVNLERAIPHINDGLKPVQRRVLYAMRRLEDGRYNKVANIVGHTMQFHPHGDASIADSLVNIGQKNVLIDCQGNWGNILTGDRAAASRYIEARLTAFALEAVFNPKTTDWKASYDGRNKEPISLPVKFPLLLLHGTEGVGVGLKSTILPHNFGEICDASVAYLRKEEFALYPDFQTGGMIDVSKYNDGQRGGKVIIRARIERIDNKTLKIAETPYGITTNSQKDSQNGLVDSIVKASEKGKINIKKIDDNTSQDVEIMVHLSPQTSSDKTIDALYAFTKCQVSYSPNCCVVDNNTPCFISISDVLRRSTDNTVILLRTELELELAELMERLLFTSLEKIFIEERIYKDKEFEQAKSVDIALNHIDKRFEPFKKNFVRDITRDDLQRLLDIKMARILRFNGDKADEIIVQLNKQIKDVRYNLEHIIKYTINWFEMLKKKYAHLYPRKTELRNFETIQVAKVVEANERLYVNHEEGFIGYALKKDENVELVSQCSDIDDVIVFFKDGKYKVVKIAEKLYVGKNILHVAVFKKNDKRTIYNTVYRNGKTGDYYIKRFAVTSITRDKENDLTQGTPGTKVVYFTANPNGEAETIRVSLKQTSRRIKNLQFEKSFSDISIKGRQSMGNILTKFDIHKIILKQKGISTLGGSDIWFDHDVLRLNTDQRGEYIGNFDGNDQILILTNKGEYYTTSFDLTNHFEGDIMRIEKFNSAKTWSVVLYDDEQKYHYIKRFQFEINQKKSSFLNSEKSSILWLADSARPVIKVHFGGGDDFREAIEVNVDEFIGVKGYKAKGRRLSNYSVKSIEEVTSIADVPETVGETEADDNESTLDVENTSNYAVHLEPSAARDLNPQEELVLPDSASIVEEDSTASTETQNNPKEEDHSPVAPKKSTELVAKKTIKRRSRISEEDKEFPKPESKILDAMDGIEIVSRNTLSDEDDNETPEIDEMTGQMSLF